MGAIRSIARRALSRVAQRVAQDNLFEKPGERQKASPLPAEVAPSATPVTASPTLCEAPSPQGLVDALRPRGRALVVHHWATWCTPCDEELPRVQALANELAGQADLIGVGWELFEDPSSPEAAAAAISDFAAERGLSWKTLLVTEDAESFFATHKLSFRKIPQTRVIGADGGTLLQVDGAMSEADLAKIRALLLP